MICFYFPSARLPSTGAALGFTVQEKATGEAIPDVFSSELLLLCKEEFAGNALQNGGNRRGSLYSHRQNLRRCRHGGRKQGTIGPV